MTNGDRIRNMSDKELATLLYNVYYDMYDSITYIDGVPFGRSSGKFDIEKWLESESRRY